MIGLSIFMTVYAGFAHAFETDHLLAVSNIVTGRNKSRLAVKDGLFWGLGHSATIFLIGILMLVMRYQLNAVVFTYLEAAVGFMLLLLGLYRLLRWYKTRIALQAVAVNGNAVIIEQAGHGHTHLPAFGVGMVHGLAGSGSLMLIVMSQMATVSEGLMGLLLFGAGSVAGMMLAAGMLSIPFSQKILQWRGLQTALLLLSAGLCIFFGCWIMYKNLLL